MLAEAASRNSGDATGSGAATVPPPTVEWGYKTPSFSVAEAFVALQKTEDVEVFIGKHQHLQKYNFQY